LVLVPDGNGHETEEFSFSLGMVFSVDMEKMVMKEDFDGPSSPFFRSMMTGLFVGIADTVLCLVYNIVYRDSGGFFSSVLINVSSIIFAVNLLFLLIGMVFSQFQKSGGKGEIAFSVIFLALTVLGCILSVHVHRFTDQYINMRFRTLLTGIVVILGVSAAVGLPLLYHSRLFRRNIV
jgi:hypothetical protein